MFQKPSSVTQQHRADRGFMIEYEQAAVGGDHYNQRSASSLAQQMLVSALSLFPS